MRRLTPFQTLGPFFDFGLTEAGAEILVDDPIEGRGIRIEGTVLDGAARPVPDALVEIWQADASGNHPRPGSTFRGFGRCGTNDEGRFSFRTVVPGRVAGPEGLQAPHLLVGVMGRGILTRLVTRIYFDDQPSNAEDTILRLVPADRRESLIARTVAKDLYRFDVVLQGERETVFFDV